VFCLYDSFDEILPMALRCAVALPQEERLRVERGSTSSAKMLS
jgi:hypothetical protein